MLQVLDKPFSKNFSKILFQKLYEMTNEKVKNLPIGVGVIEHFLTVTDSKDL